MNKPSLASLTGLYLKIGNTTFGGGDPTMAMLQRELINRQWITRDDFALAYSLARVAAEEMDGPRRERSVLDADGCGLAMYAVWRERL